MPQERCRTAPAGRGGADRAPQEVYWTLAGEWFWPRRRGPQVLCAHGPGMQREAVRQTIQLAPAAQETLERTQAGDPHPLRDAKIDTAIGDQHAQTNQNGVMEGHLLLDCEAYHGRCDRDSPKPQDTGAICRHLADLNVQRAAKEKELEPAGETCRERESG